MHRSRLHVVLIDSPPDVADAGVAFWGAVIGREPQPEPGTPFTVLAPLGAGQVLAHQRLQDGPPRIHLDVETDDTAAEVARVERLGATKLSEQEDGCVQLRDPTGLVFCVVPVQSPDFDEYANTWP
ncbi:glyoxalase/bleomycin resistance/dioxygenase family protein [Streptomyces bathyalis]|uniref:Glyoxalase/bleomycin resistance/dioxygenase family protein n=1 Tax=Streptomyces bathyalis TaxID=2710756 RepID=A0A7T1T4M3_9ACTN|nr:glyoxalase/bleomycin resistance/dioxygenase family protein [Streptomyces bathyalis]